jgi:hypothetical protein
MNLYSKTMPDCRRRNIVCIFLVSIFCIHRAVYFICVARQQKSANNIFVYAGPPRILIIDKDIMNPTMVERIVMLYYPNPVRTIPALHQFACNLCGVRTGTQLTFGRAICTTCIAHVNMIIEYKLQARITSQTNHYLARYWPDDRLITVDYHGQDWSICMRCLKDINTIVVYRYVGTLCWQCTKDINAMLARQRDHGVWITMCLRLVCPLRDIRALILGLLIRI